MAFFTGGSLFHTVKRSRSSSPPPPFKPDPDTASNKANRARSPLLTMLDAIDLMEGSEPVKAEKGTSPPTPPANSSPPGSPSTSGDEKKTAHRVTTKAERQTIMFLALDGKSATEIAKMLGLKPNTVRKFISYKKKQGLAAISASPVAQLASMSAPCKKSKKTAQKSKK